MNFYIHCNPLIMGSMGNALFTAKRLCGLVFSYVEANHVIKTEKHSWVQELDPQIMVACCFQLLSL